MKGDALGNVPILMREAGVYLASCRRQLAVLQQDAQRTIRVIEEQFASSPAGSLARRRADAMIAAIDAQVGDISALLGPLLSDEAAEWAQDALPREFPPLLQHVHQIIRDWGWPADPQGENAQALDLVTSVLDGRPTGRMVVLGAGAGRLAYDLHRAHDANETTAVDVDPLVLTVADIVTRGGSARLREANADVDDLEHVSKEWTLRAPHGAVERFSVVAANGLNPPLPDASFDTVLTPWFIDLVPSDIRAFLPVVRRLLAPNGRWVNLGPLRYGSHVPLPQRYTHQELFELAREAGFAVGRSRTASLPYLVSKLSGRGKVEWVLCFAASNHALQ